MPVAVLGLDAIDEVVEASAAYHAVQSLIEFFLNEERRCRAEGSAPRAILVVTCRDEHELQRYGLLDRGGFGVIDNPAVTIPLGNFSEEEMQRLAATLDSDAIARRVRQGVSSQTLDNYSNSPADPQAFEALKHPVIWRHFAALDELHQGLVLDAAEAGLNELAAGLLRWFCEKTRIRGIGFRPEVTRAVLHAAAGNFADPSHVGRRREDWILPAVNIAGCAQVAADKLFREALTSGLVVELSINQWQWHHMFVCRYLRANQGPSL